MSRNMILIILLIIIAFLLYNKFIAKDENKPADFISKVDVVSANWKLFKDRTGGYEVSYPNGWILVSKSNQNGMIRADISKGNEAGFQIRKYNIGQKSSDDFVTSYLDTFVSEMENHWSGNFTRLSFDKRDFYDIDYFRAEYSFLRGDGEKWFFIEYVWVKGETAVAFQCGIEDGLVEQYRGKFDLIADSFRFVK